MQSEFEGSSPGKPSISAEIPSIDPPGVLINNLVCPRHHFIAPRESAQKVMPKSWHVAKFFWIQNFHSKFFENLVLTWELTCNCYPSLGQDLSDL